MQLKKDPLTRLKPQDSINHAALLTTLTDLRTEPENWDTRQPPTSVTTARFRHLNRDRLRQEARELHMQLADLLATSFRPYAQLTAH